MNEQLQRAATRVAEGDRAAFRIIVEHTSRRLYALAARLTGSTAEGEDVVQEAYIRAYRALAGGSFDGRSSVSTWLYRITTNAAIDALRKRTIRSVDAPKKAETEASFDGAVSTEARLALKELDRWLAELPVEQRAAVVLKHVEGRTSREIAEILGCSEGSVEQRLVRAKATLRQRRNGDG